MSFGRVTWSLMASQWHAVVRMSTTQLVPLYGESLGLMGSMHFINSSTKVYLWSYISVPIVDTFNKTLISCHVQLREWSPDIWNQPKFPSAFFSGTKLIPADFLAPVETQNPIRGGLHHKVQCLAGKKFLHPQTFALSWFKRNKISLLNFHFMADSFGKFPGPARGPDERKD